MDEVDQDVVRLAIKYGNVVKFRYTKGNDKKVVEYRQLVPDLIDEKLIGGTDPDRDEYRTYRQDRILGRVKLGV